MTAGKLSLAVSDAQGLAASTRVGCSTRVRSLVPAGSDGMQAAAFGATATAILHMQGSIAYSSVASCQRHFVDSTRDCSDGPRRNEFPHRAPGGSGGSPTLRSPPSAFQSHQSTTVL